MTRNPMIPLRVCAALALAAFVIPAVGMAQEMAKVQTDPQGKFLTDADGMSLYLFEADSPNTSTCYDACAEAWPPLLTDGTPTTGGEIDAAKLGTAERRDGGSQVTYNGWPLYYFVKDQAPGDINGQDVEGFGAEWYLVAPDGEKFDED
jgi:predicted lipoprotein with Yx(FWY)xxD motif